MIACDIDGTLLNYGGGVAVVNAALLRQLRALAVREVGIVTNQGGIPWAVAAARNGAATQFPTAQQFAARMMALTDALWAAGIDIVGVRVCVFHPKAAPLDIDAAARQVRDCLAGAPWSWHVYAAENMRKPAGGMLRTFGGETGAYYGDSDEDAGAAASAGWAFVQVERFRGG